MFKIHHIDHTKPDTILMGDMKPCDIGIIVSPGRYEGHIVMRTASRNTYEVMDLSTPQADAMWETRPNIQVELMPPGFQITLTVV